MENADLHLSAQHVLLGITLLNMQMMFGWRMPAPTVHVQVQGYSLKSTERLKKVGSY